MSLTWSAPQTSRLRAWLGAFFSLTASNARTATSRTQGGPQGAIVPALALHPGLASTAHLDPQLGKATGNWSSPFYDVDAPKKVLAIPGAALGRPQREHLQDMGLRPQGASDVTNAIQLLRRDPQGWQAMIVDLDMVEQAPGDSIAFAALRRTRPDLHVILISRRHGADGDVGDPDVILKWPFSLQQLQVALDCDDYE